MTSGGKILLGLLALGGITLAVFHSGEAHADQPPAPPPPNPDPLPLPSVFPPPGTPLPGGSTVPSIPGINTLPVPTTNPGIVPLPASTSPFPATPAPSPLPAGLPSLPDVLGGLTPIPNPLAQPALPTVTPGPALPPSAPPQSPAEVPTSAPADTLALVTSMLNTEKSPHWRITDPLLKGWQSSRGRTADGQFGTGDALAMAKEIGTIPIIRAWPKGSYPGDGKLDTYRASLQQVANAAPEPRASQLRASAARENGQGYGTPETPIATLFTIQT